MASTTVVNTKGKQKLYVSAAFSALIAAMQVFAGDTSFAPWATVVLTVLGTLAVYFVPNKPYTNV